MTKLAKHYVLLIFGLFFLVHILTLNINVAEWGDSYRILRASEYLRNQAYPEDEKRPPLYSMMLALRPAVVEQVLWGRIFMLGVSVTFFWIFYAFVTLYTENKHIKFLALLFFALNPVLFYWSIRIYADVFFGLLALITLFLLKKTVATFKWQYAMLLGLMCGFAILTRFEGYLLTASVIAGLFFCNVSDFRKAFRRAVKEKWVLVSYFIALLLIEIPYMLVRNPFGSQYFDETAQRLVSIDSLLIFSASLLFIFGFTTAFSFFVINIRELPRILRMNISLLAFLALEFTLALLWPAAIPRLLVPVIPYMCVFLATSITKYFDNKNSVTAIKVFASSIILLALYLILQYSFKLQFLVSIKYLFIAVVAFQLPLVYFTYTYRYKLFVSFVTCSMLLWLTASVAVHKDIYTTVKQASVFAATNLQGIVGYNDISSVSDWYLNYSDGRLTTTGVFYNYSKKKDLELSSLTKKNLDYLLLTNEHNTNTTLDLETRPYLIQLETFETYTNGKMFWTKVLQIDKSYIKN